jgi:ACS family sodium-dependent inorganic phosphate cotransporter
MPRRYIVVLMCFMCLLICYVLRTSLSTAIIYIRLEHDTYKDEQLTAVVLSSFYWGYILSQIPGSVLAQRYGGKVVLGWGTFLASLFSVVTPWFVDHVPLLLCCRFITGLAEGVVFPVVHQLLSQWLPKSERGLVTFTWAGGNVGTVVTMLLSPLVMQHWHWPSLFYISGGLGLIWSFAWLVLIDRDPVTQLKRTCCLPLAVHELHVIQAHVPLATHRPVTPWRAILSSVTVYAMLFAHFAMNWGFYILLNYLPIYFTDKIGFKPEGLVFFLPFLAQALTTLVSGRIADRVISTGLLSVVNTRRVFQLLGTGTSALVLLLLVFTPVDKTTAMIYMVVALGFLGFAPSGYAMSHFDITPKFAGVTFGLSNTVATIPGIAGVLIVGQILAHVSKEYAWNLIFLVTAGVDIVFTVFYVACVKGTVLFE